MTTTCSPDSTTTEWPAFIGKWPRLTGRQAPEFECRHEGDEELGDKCGRFGKRIGLRCMPWQWLVLRGVLSLLAPNEWGERLFTHRFVVIECTRQNGKSLIIVLRILFGMFVLGEKRIIYTAQRWSTAEDVFDRVVAVIDRIPSLKRRLLKPPSKKDNRGVIELVNKAKVEFGPRSQDFGRGYTEIDLVFFDEAYDLDAVTTRNLEGSQRAARNPQTWYVSTSPVATVHPKCHKFSGLCRSGRKHAANLYYALFGAPRTFDRMDPEAWPLANPSYGVVGDDREMQTTLENAKTTADRLIADADYLGWAEYPPDESEIGSPMPGWKTMAVDPIATRSELVGPRALVLDRSLDRKVWILCAAQRTTAGRIYLEFGYSAQASNVAIVRQTLSVAGALDPVALVIDKKSDAAVLQPDLVEAGIEPTMTNTPEFAIASGGFLDDALDGRLAHGDQQIFNDAVANAAMRELPSGGFVWDASADKSTFSHLRAASLARWALLEYGSNVALPKMPVVATGDAQSTPIGPQMGQIGSVDFMTMPL